MDRNRFLVPHEVERLLSAVRSDGSLRDQVALMVLADTGIRVSELVRLTRADVQIRRRNLRVRRSKVRGHPVDDVALTPRLRGLLRRWIEEPAPVGEDTPLFPGRRPGLPLTTRAVQKVVSSWLAAADLEAPGRNAHALRHGFGFRIYRRFRDPGTLMAALGHRSDSCWRDYAHAEALAGVIAEEGL